MRLYLLGDNPLADGSAMRLKLEFLLLLVVCLVIVAMLVYMAQNHYTFIF